MLSAQNLGRNFEIKIHNNLSKFMDLIITSDASIKKYFNNNPLLDGIDHYLEIGNYFITIQDKWEHSCPKKSAINHFIAATNAMKESSNKKHLLSLFVSKNKMSKEGLKIFEGENNKFSRDLYISLFDKNDDMNIFIKEIVLYINEILTKKGISKTLIKNKNWRLYSHQKETVENFNKLLNQNKNIYSIVCHPTGAGKSLTALAMIGKFWKKYPTKSVLWITERKEILKSQFDNDDKLQQAIYSNFIPDFTNFNLLNWYNQKVYIDELNQELIKEKPVFLSTNIDSILYDEKYKLIYDKFGLIILDECHSSGAETTYDMLNYMKQNWNTNLIGFSATPIRPEYSKYARTANIFGDGKFVNFIHKMSFIDAIDSGIIVPPNIKWVEAEIDQDITNSKFLSHVDIEREFHQIIKYIDESFKLSKTKKGIAWTKTINNADKWINVLRKCSTNKEKYPNLSKVKYFITHTKLEYDELYDFMNYDNDCLLICVGRCREGFDDPKIDMALNLDPVESRGQIVFLQETGRALRTYKDKTQGFILDSFTINNEETKILQICNLIAGYCVLLEDVSAHIAINDCNKKYNNLQSTINIGKNRVSYKTLTGKEIVINIESTTLKKLEWNNFNQTLRERIKKHFYGKVINYETLKIIIKDLNIQTKEDYFKHAENDERLPIDPESALRGQFKGWIDYLSIEGDFYTLKEAKIHAKKLIKENNIKILYNLYEISKIFKKIDNKFPPFDLWCEYYQISSLEKIFKNSISKKRTY